jgi:iron-sulfur cluster repair protein YtfE (RIC family)
MPPSKKLTFLNIFTHVHNYLDDLFLKHQILLMRNDFQNALKVLDELYLKYEQHILDEETVLIPAYQNVVKPIPHGGSVDFFLREHRQIIRILGETKTEIKIWVNQSKFQPLRIVSVFDRYYSLHDLLNHHHAREDTFLYRLLDRNTDQSIQQKIIEKIVLLTQKAGK